MDGAAGVLRELSDQAHSTLRQQLDLLEDAAKFGCIDRLLKSGRKGDPSKVQRYREESVMAEFGLGREAAKTQHHDGGSRGFAKADIVELTGVLSVWDRFRA